MSSTESTTGAATTTLKMAWLLSFLNNLRLRLGLGRTSPTPVTKYQEVWLFDNTAFPTPRQPGKWSAEFVAAYFEEDSGSDAAKVVAEIADLLGFAGDKEAEGRIAERVEPFLNLILAGKYVDVAFGGEAGEGRVNDGAGILRLGSVTGYGISVNELALPGEGYVDDQVVESSAVFVEGKAAMRTAFAGEDGWGVISDIDDTIKISEVRNRVSLLKHTFVGTPTPVPGMPELYQAIQSRLHKPVWFYLSASPYNLYPLLRSFTSSHFPHGQLILREMTWMELESFVVSLTVGTQRYKEERIRRVLAWLPQRRWLLVGDSTQTDPEAYATIYKEFRERVGAIWIRLVKGVDEEKEKQLNSVKRFEKAFDGVPSHVWRTFELPGELEGCAGEL
ncbi:hypothetical protein L873DRAFT_1804784 [Choiromyces venosus 120613-1]|uniref:Phosphatidate phosphatase APP1 catalytic domain-containing protein n=1 Tax=Choiromyces venosus 120613-1 TaxID=1336337 RepID=A0A3N4JUJ5_9PEZI|nr:hypothetical protein L873DRAFT_1804784 [Choiromyces venosus 120613-1]